MSGPKQLYCGTCLKLKDGVCASWGEATAKDSPACAEYEGATKRMSEPTEQINENQSLKGFGVSEEMPEHAELAEFDLNKIPGVKEAQQDAWEKLCANIQNDRLDGRVRRHITVVKVNPETLETTVSVVFEPPKTKAVKLEVKSVYGVRENGVIKFESAKQEPLFPKG